MIVYLLVIIVSKVLFYRRYRKYRRIKWLFEVINILFVVYLLKLIQVTIIPMHHGSPGYFAINMMPFQYVISDIKLIGISYGGDGLFQISLILKNVLGNTLLLVPFGLYLAVIFKDKVKWYHGFYISLFIEVSQLIMTYIGLSARISDIDDLILNTLGFTFAIWIMKRLSRIKWIDELIDYKEVA